MKALLKKILPTSLYMVLKYHYTTRWNEPSRYKALYQLIRRNKSRRILEIGTWNGERALRMLYASKRATGMPAEYYGFDLFDAMDQAEYEREISKKPPSYEEVKSKLLTSGARIKLYQGNTLQTLPESIDSMPKMDFIFIDGGHHVDTVKNDWEYSQKVMHENTVVIFDDYWHNRKDHGARPIVDAIDTKKYEVVILPVINTYNTNDFGRLEISFARVSFKK
ncbi:hypothetical protein COU16_00190 [Candidatus Kaiserbacteria bacterium CG10_big_fil_rev_8_21_14_0_10_47_16]|uniref:Class I SAM-dependent methyltransferase n=1 Tax=Candidatus Kaiserbacteria bacterium CG10_big_fil_rev_8_21_14_0_10_47_16 TaxID=1974608 RepID=A0A2H0UGJ8_9BACT|nr:MAG: hypothetical protein COU16_00190 [Candidatus Kaiserbacteria bacterium CG10_big_fil_rev_8_21_14_0_10_47_16]